MSNEVRCKYMVACKPEKKLETMNVGDDVRIGVEDTNIGTIIYYGKVVAFDNITATVAVEANVWPFVTNEFTCNVKRSDMMGCGGVTPSLTPCCTVVINKDIVCPICADKGTFDFGRLCICPDSLRKAKG